MRTKGLLLVCFLSANCGDDGDLLPTRNLEGYRSHDDVVVIPPDEEPLPNVEEGEEDGVEGHGPWEPRERTPRSASPRTTFELSEEDPEGGEEEAVEEGPVEEDEVPVDEGPEDIGEEVFLDDVPVPTETSDEETDETVTEDADEEMPEDVDSGPVEPSCVDGVDHYMHFYADGSFTIIYCEDETEEEAPETSSDDDGESEDVEDDGTDEEAVEEEPIEEDEVPADEEEVEEPSDDTATPGDDDDEADGDDAVVTEEEAVETEDGDEEPSGDDDREEDPHMLIDADGDGFPEDEDCDDLVAAINPGVVEVCDDGVDNNCNAFADAEAEVDGCMVPEEPIEDLPPDDPPAEEEEGEPSVTVAPSDTTNGVEPQVVTAGSEGVVLGKFGLACRADGCLVKSITVQVAVDNTSYDVHEIVGRCRLNQAEPVESGIGGPQPLDRHAKYLSSANFWLETESVPQFVLLCDIVATVPADAVQLTAYLVLEETEVWDQDFNVLPLSCDSSEGNPVIGVVNITPP